MLRIQLQRTELLCAGRAAARLSSCPSASAQLRRLLHAGRAHRRHASSWAETLSHWSYRDILPPTPTSPGFQPAAFPPCLLHLAWALATLPEPLFPMLTFEMPEIKFLTLCFPKVIYLDLCTSLQPNRAGRMAVPFVRPLTAVPSQVQAIPASPAELLKLCSALTIPFMSLGTTNSQIFSTMKIKLNLIAD